MHERSSPVDRLWAVIPVKPLGRSKERLRGCLGALRPDLALAMLRDLLAALADSVCTDGVIVVTPDERVARLAAAAGARVVEEELPADPDSGDSMNRAIERGVVAARLRGATLAAVVPVDVPLLTGAEFDRLAERLQTEAAGTPLGIVASRDGGGTNWLCLGTETAFTPQYGPGSCARHLEQARGLGLEPLQLESPTLSLDIDDEEDLQAYVAYCRKHQEFRHTHTWRFLQGIGYDPGSGRWPGPAATEASRHA